MPTKYARVPGGNWSADATWSLTSGGLADTTAPTAADDVILDASSGNVTIDAASACRSLDCDSGSAYTGTLTHNASTNLSIGDATAGAGNIAFRLSAGTTYNRGASAALLFVSTSATQQTVTTAGKPLPFINFNGAGGSWILSDAVTVAGTTFRLTAGTLDTNSQTIVAPLFSSNNSGVRTLTLGSSSITLSLAGTAWDFATVTNLTVIANTATVTLTGAGATFTGGGASFNWNGLSVVMSGSGIQAFNPGVNASFANVTRTGTAVKTDGLTLGNSNFTVTGTFTVTGDSAINRILVASNGIGTARTITAAAVSLTNVDFRDITAAGAAAPFTGSSIGDALGNTNITVDTPITCYRVGAGGNWSTSNWYTTSGGATPARVPLPQDNAVIDANASGTITNDMPRMGADITCTGFTGVLTFSVACDIYGSVTLDSGMTTGAGTALIQFLGRSSHTITTNGVVWRNSTTVGALGAPILGIYTLGSAFTSNRSSDSALTIAGGEFNDAGFPVIFTGVNADMDFRSDTSGTLTGIWTIGSTTEDTPVLINSGSAVNFSGCTIILSGATATDRTFAGGGKTYGTLTDQNTLGGKLTLTGANTFTTINKTATVACTLTLPSATTTTVTNFNVNGVAANLLTLNSSTPASAAILSKPTGVVSCDYLSIQDSTATGGARYFAGTNSVDVSGNTGWNFQDPTYNTSSTGIIG